MKRYALLFLIAVCAAPTVFADYDPVLEAQEQAAREAAQRREQAEQQEMQRMQSAAQAKARQQLMDGYRKELGSAATGKSDAEVVQLMELKQRAALESANQAMQQARQALGSGQGAAAVQQVTGKTMQELENMSDADAEALARELERKYGQ